MKKGLYLIIIYACMTLLCGCDKLPANGDLDGLWQLVEIKKGDEVTDVRENHLYCSFQLKLFMLGNANNPRAFFGYFEHTDSTMHFYNFTFRSDYTEDNNYDKPMFVDKDMTVISPWGFYSMDCTYDVLKLDAKEMVLRHETTEIRYKKL